MSDRSNSRIDFVKRLFAVAVSVGFASQLSRLLLDPNHAANHALNLSSILLENWKSISLLSVSLVAVVASWEGYLRAVEDCPLEDSFRFYLDIVIVLCYLVMSLTSQFYSFWFGVLPTIFLLYAIWDIARMQMSPYKEKPARSLPHKSLTITVVWLIFFVVLAAIHNLRTNIGFIVAASTSGYGVIVYRVDKSYRFLWYSKGILFGVPLLILCVVSYLIS